MKLPGKAYLEFKLEESKVGMFIRQTAGFEMKSWFGVLYWYGLYPLHFIIFEGMLRKIVRKSNQFAEQSKP